MKTRFIRNLILVLILAHCSQLASQAPVDTVEHNMGSIMESQIPTEIDNLGERIDIISKRIAKIDDIIRADSVVQNKHIEFSVEREHINEEMQEMTYRRLEKRIRAWKNYKSKLLVYQQAMEERSAEFELIKSELADEYTRWESLDNNLKLKDVSRDVIQSVDTVLYVLGNVKSEVTNLSEYLFIIQRRQTQLKRLIENTISEMEESQRLTSITYFVFDSKPIWGLGSLADTETTLQSYFLYESNNNLNILLTYLRTNRSVVISQLLFIIVLMGGFILLGRLWPVNELDKMSRREMQAGFIIRRPFFSSLLISLLISIFFYTNRPLILSDTIIFLMLIASVVLLPGLLTKKLRIPLLIFTGLFLITFLQDFVPIQSIINRVILIAEAIVIIYLLWLAYRFKNDFYFKSTGLRLYKVLIRIFISVIAIAILADIFGMVKLGHFLINATARQLYFTVIIVTIVIIMNSLMILLIKGKHAQSLPLYEKLKQLIDKRIRPMINWGAFALWLFVFLIYFMLLKPVNQMLDTILGFEITISALAISIGALVSFALIIVVAFILVRFTKNVFRDEWVSNSILPRGTANALSMLIRYVIVVVAVYLALISIGINLDKFGFIAGALGVGIGFGLQNIVLNFISGLILAVERPFHIGDVIEVDNYMGRVTDIGVRASKIKTWDGSELIVPNGLLISKKVNNWTLTDQKRRLVINISTNTNAIPKKVIDILTNVAGSHQNTLKNPAPMAIFNGYGNSSLDFTLYCWVEFAYSLKTKSEVALNVHAALGEAGISVPFPFHKVEIGKLDNKHLKE